jgi:hypothetical protein
MNQGQRRAKKDEDMSAAAFEDKEYFKNMFENGTPYELDDGDFETTIDYSGPHTIETVESISEPAKKKNRVV